MGRHVGAIVGREGRVPAVVTSRRVGSSFLGQLLRGYEAAVLGL